MIKIIEGGNSLCTRFIGICSIFSRRGSSRHSVNGDRFTVGEVRFVSAWTVRIRAFVVMVIIIRWTCSRRRRRRGRKIIFVDAFARWQRSRTTHRIRVFSDSDGVFRIYSTRLRNLFQLRRRCRYFGVDRSIFAADDLRQYDIVVVRNQLRTVTTSRNVTSPSNVYNLGRCETLYDAVDMHLCRVHARTVRFVDERLHDPAVEYQLRTQYHLNRRYRSIVIFRTTDLGRTERQYDGEDRTEKSQSLR